MIYFEDLKTNPSLIKKVSRFGDKIILDDFANMLSLNTNPSVLIALSKNGKAMVINQIQKNRGGGVLVCGSPNEVAPDPTLDDYFDVVNNDLDCVGCLDSYGNYFIQKQTVWTMTTLEAEDQLCQRMAWALYEHLNSGTTTNPENTESNLYAYDTFTRHCFGSYFDILKEMAYSPKMGEQFNFVLSSSTRYNWDMRNIVMFPDENFGEVVFIG